MPPEKTNNYLSGMLRTKSCISSSPESALAALLANDYETLTCILADICPIPDDAEKTFLSQNEPGFPLPDDHWINTPTDEDNGWKTMLQIAVGNGQREITKLLLTTGARCDLYNERDGSTALHSAVKNGDLTSVKILLEGFVQKPRINQANINGFDRNGQTVLHLAAGGNTFEVLRYLLENQDLENVDSKDLMGGQTPLIVAIKAKNAQAAELLISYGANVNERIGSKTARDLIRENMSYFDPEKVVKIANKRKAWNVAEHLGDLLDKGQRNRRKGLSNGSNLLEFMIFMQQKSTDEEKQELNQFNSGGLTLMQKACDYGLHKHVEAMLDHGLDPNSTTEESSQKPLLAAAYYGYHEILAIFKNHYLNTKDPEARVCFSNVEKASRESVLTWILKKQNPSAKDAKAEICGYGKCVRILFDDFENQPESFRSEIERIINYKDSQANSPLHYASQLWNQETVLLLLERGANIGLRNLWDETPISMIMPETMETFLDDYCLKWKNEVTHEDFEVEYNYSFLAPPVESLVFDESDPEGRNIVEKAALPETESIWYMSRSKNHRHLLNHPVIGSFLYLKWRRLRVYFNRNLRFYALLVMCLTWYIFERFGGVTSRMTRVKDGGSITFANGTRVHWSSFCGELSSRYEDGYGFWYIAFAVHALLQVFYIFRDWRQECQDSCKRFAHHFFFTSWIELVTAAVILVLLIFKSKGLLICVSVLTLLLMLRELFQASASLKRYLASPENWLECALIGLIIAILWVPDSAYKDENCGTKRHLAAIAILLSWAEMITMVARHPKLAIYNTYVTMFYKVLKTFLVFLFWYSFFIIAFGLGFYIMLHNDLPGRDPSGDQYYFFNYPWLTLVKTSTMFVGEIEFSDIPIDIASSMSPLAYSFLLAFVFLIVVVLMNLLNGLAVSDTGKIREQAEIVSATTSVETISYIESVLTGDPFKFLSNWPPFKWLKALPSLTICDCLYRSKRVRDLSNKIAGSTGILLFYTILESKRLTLHPNKRSYSCFHSSAMSAAVIAQTKAIIVKKEEEKRLKSGKTDTEEKIREVAEKVQNLEANIAKIMKALNI